MKKLFKMTNDKMLEGKAMYYVGEASKEDSVRELITEMGAKLEAFAYPVALENLPQETQAEVKNILRAYDECSVIYENGTFDVSPDMCIKFKYANDYMVINRYKQTEIYTLEERKQNFFEEFGYHSCFIR